MNPIMNMASPQAQPVIPQGQPVSNQFMARLQEFSQMVHGNPEQIARNLMLSGRMTQEQFQQYAQVANSILGKRS